MNTNKHIELKIAGEEDREQIYLLRHEIYAVELGQHKENSEKKLQDSLDQFNTYIVIKIDGKVAGFVSVTSPGGRYGLDKYISRDEFSTIYENMYEGRLFSIVKEHRTSQAAMLLFYAFFRWVEDQGGDRIITYGRKELVDLYKKTGLYEFGRSFTSGKVAFSLMGGQVPEIREKVEKYARLVDRLSAGFSWNIGIPLHKEKNCYHGGQFYQQLGTDFSSLDKIPEIINADVLDAWFPPAPAVTEVLEEHLAWICKTSPPTHSEGLVKAVSRARGIPAGAVLTGAGSSALIYLALPRLLSSSSRVLLLDPVYGEYLHILDHALYCNVDRFVLSFKDGYRIDLEKLAKQLQKGYDAVILVNPNNPTGSFIDKSSLEELVKVLPQKSILWIDETYIDYMGEGESFEQSAWKHKNVVVCKSMSKVFALSGLRAAYLCGHPDLISELKIFSPPWAVSLPAQLAAIKALDSASYYNDMYKKTRLLREEFRSELEKSCQVKTFPGAANFFMVSSVNPEVKALQVVEECRKQKVFLRDLSSMGQSVPACTFRAAVKDSQTNRVIVEAIKKAVGGYN